MGKNFSKYQKIIIDVANNFYTNGNHHPKKVDYCAEVVRIYNTKPHDAKITEAQARFQIARVIDQLSEGTNNQMLCLQGKYYVINNEAYLNEKLSEEYYLFLKDKIRVLRKDIIEISYNMCGVLVEPQNGNDKIVKIISDCLGDNCFNVTKGRDIVLIMLKCNPEDNYIPTGKSNEYLIMTALGNTISRIYEDQKKEGLKPLKRKRKQKQKKNSSSPDVQIGS